jgi:serine/threonine-protein kinase RsbW
MDLMENQKLSISSKTENMVLVEKMVEDVCRIFNISEDHYGNILVALTEAVNNAIFHGNQSDPLKKIDIAYTTEGKALLFTIKDDGPGFDFSNLPDPTNPENIEKPNGRGVFLMRHLADDVLFEDRGSKAILKFNVL